MSDMSPGRGVEYREWIDCIDPWGEPLRSRGSATDLGPSGRGIWSGEGMEGIVCCGKLELVTSPFAFTSMSMPITSVDGVGLILIRDGRCERDCSGLAVFSKEARVCSTAYKSGISLRVPQ